MQFPQYLGDEEAGFSVMFDAPTRTIRVRVWGFWADSLAESFSTTVIGACEASQSVAAVAIDAAEFKPQREAAQRTFGSVVAALGRLRVGRLSFYVTNALTKLQLMRIAKEKAPAGLVLQFTTHA